MSEIIFYSLLIIATSLGVIIIALMLWDRSLHQSDNTGVTLFLIIMDVVLFVLTVIIGIIWYLG